MGAWLRSETFWLDFTNIGLGVVTLVCFLAVGFGVVQDLLPTFLRRRATREDDHSIFTRDLGLTMADGGRRIHGPRKLLFWRRKG